MRCRVILTAIAALSLGAIFALPASAAALTAALTDSSWQNTTSPSPSPIEAVKHSGHPGEIPSTHLVGEAYSSAYTPRASTTTILQRGTVVPETVVVAQTSVSLPSSPTSTQSCYMTSMTDVGNLSEYLHNITAGIGGLIRAHSTESKVDHRTSVSIDENNIAPNIEAPASATGSTIQSAASLAMIEHAKYNIIFLNTTSPSYVLLDHHNTKVLVWTASDGSSPAAQDSRMERFLNHATIWLSLLEVLGAVAFFWKVGAWTYCWVKGRRGRRGQDAGVGRAV